MSKTAKLKELSRDLTNSELDDIVGDINLGEVVVIDKRETSNDKFVNLYLYGPVEGVRSESSGVSKAQARLLGWDNSSNNMRCIANASKDIADDIELGDKIEGCIRVTDYLEEQFDGHNPRTNSNGDLLYYNDGEDLYEVYRYTEFVDEEELEAKGHSVLKVSAIKDDEESDDNEEDTKEQPAKAKVKKLVKSSS